MDTVLRYRGRNYTSDDIRSIREVIAAHPDANRFRLSERLCEAWDWRQPNGHLRDMVARGLMLALHRAGEIELPAPRGTPRESLGRRHRPRLVEIDATPIIGDLADLRPLEFRRVRRTADEPLFNSLLEQHHYLGYTQPVGEHLKYLVFAQGRPIACLVWQSAPRHLGPRDRFIGWSAEARLRNIRFLAYNPRYLILPWVKVPHLASHILGKMARIVQRDFEEMYGHTLHYLETFVDPDLYRGTCYFAANWVELGWTTGRGKDSVSKKPNRTLKKVLGYPLTQQFRERLGALS
ncbi:MAG TPA: DUF4338 domain-containing protein [Polyangiaceae bacterium]|nr:DUF4338 domain-containing protein [Polyangiaceae bacterium]